jgi:hypothetical protein
MLFDMFATCIVLVPCGHTVAPPDASCSSARGVSHGHGAPTPALLPAPCGCAAGSMHRGHPLVWWCRSRTGHRSDAHGLSRALAPEPHVPPALRSSTCVLGHASPPWWPACWLGGHAHLVRVAIVDCVWRSVHGVFLFTHLWVLPIATFCGFVAAGGCQRSVWHMDQLTACACICGVLSCVYAFTGTHLHVCMC